ncbi:DUF2029 domain-containing protein [Cyanobium sp. NIES-981]|uniref:DUF2029 domain-containing protein n=1 Tax=Cyanobium sp. NIES-981 TaxID=1851505 RepID=UPI0007DCFBE5|nr:DUF2029 domain-containing protein [Cyanobium sp. NIES-981]SBO42058.1 conserved membrane protein of unknown function [Cyanobium sp. NIES-981]
MTEPSFRSQQGLLIACGVLLVAGAALVSPYGHFRDPLVLQRFWPGAAVMGLGFALSWRLAGVPAAAFWGVAIATRLLLLPMEPSDDLWRYLWEGKIQLEGFNPFLLAPDAPALEALRTPWWGQINHPGVTAIYPPLTQLLFRLLALAGPSVLLLKLGVVAADLAVCALLARRFGHRAALLVAWNPLVLVCLAGGGHFDSWFVLPLVAAWLLLEPAAGPGRQRLAALLVGLSAAIKWTSLPMLALLVWQALRQRQWRHGAALAALGLLPLAAAALPFCSSGVCPLIPLGSGFVRFGRSAELVPALVGRLWPWTLAHNSLFLAVLALLSLVLVAISSDLGSFSRRWLLALLMLSPIVHLWYVSWYLPFAVPTRAWGARLVSLSGFVYFVLPSRLPDWRLSGPEGVLFWAPLLLGLGLEALASHRRPLPDRPLPDHPLPDPSPPAFTDP